MDEASAGGSRTRKTYAARLLLVLCSLAPSVFPLTGFAQTAQQTPESAQRFLATALPREYTITFNNNNYDERTAVSEIRSLVACETIWHFSNILNPNRRLDDGINWRGVIEVRQESTFVYITQEGYIRRYNLRSESLAARATFAMEFLRLHCDPTADTGF